MNEVLKNLFSWRILAAVGIMYLLMAVIWKTASRKAPEIPGVASTVQRSLALDGNAGILLDAKSGRIGRFFESSEFEGVKYRYDFRADSAGQTIYVYAWGSGSRKVFQLDSLRITRTPLPRL